MGFDVASAVKSFTTRESRPALSISATGLARANPLMNQLVHRHCPHRRWFRVLADHHAGTLLVRLRLAIRQSTTSAVRISTIIVQALRETNARGCSAAIIDCAAANFSPSDIVARVADRLVLVATIDEKIVGTASLHQSTVRIVFVRPDRQKRGIGSALMREIERSAGTRSVAELTAPSSVTAEAFYRRLGFIPLRDEFHGEGRTIIMTKQLSL